MIDNTFFVFFFIFFIKDWFSSGPNCLPRISHIQVWPSKFLFSCNKNKNKFLFLFCIMIFFIYLPKTFYFYMAKKIKAGRKKIDPKEKMKQVNFYTKQTVIERHGGMEQARTKCKQFLEDDGN